MSGEDDGFNSKNWVWVPDSRNFFSKGYVTDYLADGQCKVTVMEGNQEQHRVVASNTLENCNPVKFNKCNDMAELTHLNEPSVVYNLYLRYNDDMIYTYSGLFLVAINPYKSLPVYDAATLKRFHDHTHDKPPPHIYATAEGTYRNLLANGKDQSILVTGESGAGKTENTKKIIQYLSSITSEHDSNSGSNSDIDTKILQANPILESFGNAKTIKNNNSSRFGKFIKIFVSQKGNISGANIEYYLLEKSRVVHQVANERNYHVFYQFLKGAGKETLSKYKLNKDVKSHNYLKESQAEIPHVDDAKDFQSLVEAFAIMGFADKETKQIFAMLAVVLHLGDLEFTSWKSEQASFTSTSPTEIIANLLGIKKQELVDNLLRPKVKAGREFVSKSQKASAVKYAIDAFAKYLFERIFQYIIQRINDNLDIAQMDNSDSNFIGVLDIAGFEIFEQNSFEQLCINYTNEKLQQFFNHHSFILEQSEYLREDIEWEFIDFGQDLQPTIDLIETKKPMGIFAILDEECMVPKSSDKTFMENLASQWGNGQNKKFQQNKYKSGFIVHHYAGMVEYNVDNWLQKNTDPVTEGLLKLLPNSENSFVSELFVNDEHLVASNNNNKRGGKLKTASQKHKEQLTHLMEQLGLTEPHFVRCILPNLEKKPNKFDKNLVLLQLRCNGVLEGIRIARAGYPNKMTFEEFYQRYSILDVKEVFTKNMKTNSELIIKHINLDAESYKVGITKLFFKNGVLGKLEELRDLSLKGIFTEFQSLVRGKSTRKTIKSKIAEIQASQLIAKNFKAIHETRKSSLWLDLFINIKPLLEDSVKVLDSKEVQDNLKSLTKKLKEAEMSKEKLEGENTKLQTQMQQLENEVISTTSLMKERDSVVDKLKSEEKKSRSKIETLSSEIKSIQQKFDVIFKTKTSLESDIEDHKQKLQESLQKHEKIVEQHSAAEKNILDLNEKLKVHEKEKSKHQTILDRTIMDHESSVATLTANSEKLKVENERVTKEVNTLTEKLNKLTKKHESLLEEKKSFSSGSDELKKEIENLSAKCESLSKERDLLTQKHARLTEKYETVNKDLSASTSSASEKNDLLKSLKAEISKNTSTTEKLSRDKSLAENSLSELQLKLRESEKSKSSLQSKCNKLEVEVENLTGQIKTFSDKERELQDTHKKELAKLEQLDDLKSELQTITNEKEQISASYQKLKVEYETSKSAQQDYSKQILDMKEQMKELESNTNRNKENVPPPEPSFVNEFANIKLKLNEQSASLRKEKFENQKLNEELKQLKGRIISGDSERKSASFRRSLAIGEEVTLNSNYLREEIDALKFSLEQEESNAQRAENYAIELQKKLNKLQSSRGIGNSTDFEKKYKESQMRIQELEDKINNIVSQEDSPKRLSKSESFGRSSLINKTLSNANQDFVKIYQDVSKTLKVTRDELSGSKSEILRLKSLLRESEDELYDAKRQTFKTSISDYESELAQLKVRYDSVSAQNVEINASVSLYKKRADEYYKKLELAESAINISQRHEQTAARELAEAKNQLHLAREEARASQILITDVRRQNTTLENTISDKEYAIKQSKEQIKTLVDKIEYFTTNYENVENQEKYKEEIRVLNKDLNFKLETETILIKDNKKLQLDLEEMTREKEELDAECIEQQQKLNEFEINLAEATKRVRTLENEKAIHERKITNFTKQVTSLKDLVGELTQEKDNLLQEKETLEEDLIKLTQTHEDTQATLTQTEADMAVLRDHLENQRESADAIRSELNQSKISTTNDIQDYSKLKRDLLVTNEENDSLKKVNQELNSKVHSLEEKLYSNEQLKYWESKVNELTGKLDQSEGSNYESSKTIKSLERELKKLEIRVQNESQLTKKYNDENFDYQNKVNHYKSTIDILHSESSEKELLLKAAEREKIEMKENMLILEREVLELRSKLGI
ncbi:myosin-1 [[Candida] anglica]|uniref:Myosin-1 n=1 Tax=[Candida] anglica TaxID=148631 RepID=A0ABP0EH87_9ASCO